MDSGGAFPFHPTVVFDGPYWVHDFTRPSPEGWTAPYPDSVGRSDEHRPAMYPTELFEGERHHPVGLDLGAPVHTHGHLSLASISHWKPGDTVDRGAVLAALGNEDENGGWAPHVHVQLSWEAPLDGDLPGVVRPENRLEALEKYPDPRLICGPLY